MAISENFSMHPAEEIVLSQKKKAHKTQKHILFRHSVKEREEAFLHSLEIDQLGAMSNLHSKLLKPQFLRSEEIIEIVKTSKFFKSMK